MSIYSRLRNPEYTGVNRCIPCTLANTGIALLLSASVLAASILALNLAPLRTGTFAGGLFAVSLTTIYFRGYLVPGTPELTKRYFPDRVLAWSDKTPITDLEDSTISVNPEEVLLAAGAVEPCQNESDLCLRPDFETAWHNHITDLREQQPGEAALTRALDIPPHDDDIQFDHREDGMLARTATAAIGQWSSDAAIIADVAAATALQTRYPNWDTLNPAEIARVLLSLRIFIDQCSSCSGPVHVEQEVVESCCRSHDVIASVCQSCDARLLEMEWNDPDDLSEPTQNHPEQASA